LSSYYDLRSFLTTLEKEEKLVKIDAEADPDLEVAEVARRVFRKGGPALWFKKVTGSPYPLAVNIFGTTERVNKAFEVGRIEEVAAEVEDLLSPLFYPGRGFMDKLKYFPHLFQMGNFVPRQARKPSCQEVVEKTPNLGELPALRSWPGEGGPSLTMPLVITRDPETHQQNMGIYRMQILESKTATVRLFPQRDGAVILSRYREKGEKMPAAVALGGDPATIFAALAPLPLGVDEMLWAGFLRKSPLEVTRCRTLDLYVPAQAEFVLEGYIDPEETHKGSLMGEPTGHYSPPAECPVFHMTCMTRKRNPILPATVLGEMPMESSFLIKAAEKIFLPLLKLYLPEVADFSFVSEGGIHGCALVSIEKSYPGQARKVLHALWGMKEFMFAKVLVVVDRDVDLNDLPAVFQKVIHSFDPHKDLVISEGALAGFDLAARTPGYGWKVGIDATRKGAAEGHEQPWPEGLSADPDIQEMVDRKWSSYGLGEAGR